MFPDSLTLVRRAEIADLAGKDVVRRTNYALTIPPPGEAFRPLQSDCSTLRAR